MSQLILSNLDFNNQAKITNLVDGSAPQDAVTFAQLSASIEGLQPKGVAVVATQGNVSLASLGATIDTVTMLNGMVFLVKAQTLPAENGLYIYNGPSTLATRSANMNASAEFNNAIIQVADGSNAGSTYRCTTLNPTVGTTAINFVVFGSSVASATETSAGIAEIATQVETDTGTDDLRFVTPLKLKSSSLLLKKYGSTFGDGSATQFDFSHTLNTLDVEVSVYVVATGKKVMCDVTLLTTSSIRLNFASAPASNALRIVVVG